VTDPAEDARDRFARLAATPDPELDVEEGAILIAAEEYPGLDVAGVRAELDRLGEAARGFLEGARDAGERVERLNRLIFDELGFEGASEYFDPRNSYLNEVLERRVGIPITLALVYIGAGRRAGMDLRGVSVPGHFLVKCAGSEEHIVDAFHGRSVTREECAARLASALGPETPLSPAVHLRDATSREILVRMLSNLQRIFAERGDAERLLACCDRILLLVPRSPQALRDRALVYQRLGWLAAAVGDLEAALEVADDPQLARALADRRDVLRLRLGPVH
jgi:regulator of sirC expression with transglutaminase-like and TPR domain